MEFERKGVVIEWQIDNAEYIFCQRMEFYSPVISLNEMDGTKWRLVMHRLFPPFTHLSIKREEDDGPQEYGLDYEFSFKELHRSFSTGTRSHSFTFKKNEKCPESQLLSSEREKACSLDTFIIRCKIWRQLESILKSGHFFARTRIKTQRCNFLGVVENFSAFPEGEEKIFKVVSLSTGEKLIGVKLRLVESYLENGPYIFLEVFSIDNTTERYFTSKSFILDSYGNKHDIGKKCNVMPARICSFSKENLLKNAAQYLPNDTLSLYCELTICSGKEYEDVERIEYDMNLVGETKQRDSSRTVEDYTTRKGILCDTKIQTATETFPVHTTILSGQSPVFEAMFNSNMKETIEKCVYIDDVEAETVKRMLLFLYSDSLEDLGWKAAMKLYVAADKYQILSLKEKCTVILKQGVDLSNCCVLSRLADMHQDNTLKADVDNYIARNLPQIIHCDQWRDLKKKFPHLANETWYARNTYVDEVRERIRRKRELQQQTQESKLKQIKLKK